MRYGDVVLVRRVPLVREAKYYVDSLGMRAVVHGVW
jgi:hypothetical protein